MIFSTFKMQTLSEEKRAEFLRKIESIPEITECHTIFGEMDVLGHRPIDELYQTFIFNTLMKLPGVTDIHSTVTLAEVKYTTQIPVRPPRDLNCTAGPTQPRGRVSEPATIDAGNVYSGLPLCRESGMSLRGRPANVPGMDSTGAADHSGIADNAADESYGMGARGDAELIASPGHRFHSSRARCRSRHTCSPARSNRHSVTATPRYVSAFVRGNLHVVRQLQRRYGVDADAVLCTTGASSSLSLIFRALLNRGDRVLVENPAFDLFAALNVRPASKSIASSGPRRIRTRAGTGRRCDVSSNEARGAARSRQPRERSPIGVLRRSAPSPGNAGRSSSSTRFTAIMLDSTAPRRLGDNFISVSSLTRTMA